MSLHLWIIPLLPLAGAAINGLLGKRFSKALVNTIALGSTALAFAYAVWVALQFAGMPADQIPYIEPHSTWMAAGSFAVNWGFYLDQLSLVMLLIVTGVGFVIHIFSVGYMDHEGGYYRYFAYLNIFMFFMLMLILADNYLQMFVGWEGVGLASYLLIGFWFLKPSAANAGKKAFITNRVGDFGFLIALFLLIKHFGTLQYDAVFKAVAPYPVETSAGLLTAIGLLMLFGATGKSAQIPLYVWLPDAMEGPTPVSALIHAATMVTAGVYMVARSHAIFDRATRRPDGGRRHRHVDRDLRRLHRHGAAGHQEGPRLLDCLATRLHVHGLRRRRLRRGHLPPDDPRILQGPALPLLGRDHSRLGGEQDMRRMGGLRKFMPYTFWSMTIATFTIAGFPPWQPSSPRTRFCGRPGPAATTCCG